MREDPFADLWQSEVVPQVVAETGVRLQALKLFTWLCRPPRVPFKLLK